MDSEAIALLQDLVRIDSQNPPGDERKIVDFIKKYLAGLNIRSEITEFKKNRPNLVCRLRSKNSRKKILITPHIDTVPFSGKWKFGPLSGHLYKGRIYGRGATDCKANAAVCLALIKELKEKNISLENLDLIFAFCADEETGSHWGTIPLVKKFKGIDYGLVLDADEFDIVSAQKGLFHLRVELFGKEAHGAYPWRGVNALEKGVKILAQIMDKGLGDFRHSLLNKPTLNIGRLCGGDKVNIVAGWCFFELDIRYLPAMKMENILADIEKIIKKQKIKYRVKIMAHQKPIEISADIRSIKVLRKVLKNNKIKSRLKASFGATVINYLQDRNFSASLTSSWL
jgi:succinyl-diaminopimelate desuccinylase